MRVSALVLARSGSKSIPDKNTKLLNGLPLICHCLEVLAKCSFFTDIWVSTDSERIAGIVHQFNSTVKIHMRSISNSADCSSSIQSAQEFLSGNKDIDVIGLVQCTSPCLRKDDLWSAYEKMSSGFDSVFSVFSDRGLHWKITDEQHLVPLNFDPMNRPRRQDIKANYTESGHFYFATRTLIQDDGLFQSQTNGSFVEIPERLCLELDYLYQWPIAELLLSNGKISSDLALTA